METIFLKDLTGLQDTVVTIGAYDGLHLGHLALLKTVITDGRSIQGKSVLLTFGDHPRQVIQGGEVGLINTPEQRAEILSRLKLDYLAVIDDEDIFKYSAEKFIDLILGQKLKAREVVAGFNFRFGRNRTGDAELLRRRGALLGFKVKVVEPVLVAGEIVSSSRIRELLAEGRVEEASVCLGRPYEIRGTVVAGQGRGTGIGFPTANLKPDIPLLVDQGIYTAEVSAPQNPEAIKGFQKALASYGVNPTFKKLTEPVLEILIPGFEGDIYGARLCLRLLRKIRPQKRFKGRAELAKAIEKDLTQL
ncbi:MAG: riboflavin biosynthesis protein RibF [Candidatus Ratteibacteria bacterium]|jgi:riboflavin kinase/FMN adenylyltransferase